MKLLVLLTFSALNRSLLADVACMDMSNKPVDWFVFYKLPKDVSSSNAHIANGTGFLYIDSNNRSNWTLPKMGMETGDHAVSYTLQHYYRGDPNIIFSVMYNDEFPDSTIVNSDKGHTKGVSVFDQRSGYWLIHSIPKFPSNVTYDYPPNAHYYGQMGFCVTFSYKTLDDISQQLYFNEPFIYELNIPMQFSKDFPTLNNLRNETFNLQPPFYRMVSLTSLAGQKFNSFAKSGKWSRDLYYDLVAAKLYTNLEVESWQHAQSSYSNLHSWCSSDGKTEVFDVAAIQLPFGINFSNYDDHSKYAISFALPGKISLPWVCIGDINRQEHQQVRGGGTLCINDSALYNVFQRMIAQVNPCNGTHAPPNPDAPPTPIPPHTTSPPLASLLFLFNGYNH